MADAHLRVLARAIGANVSRRRREKGLTQAGLAEAAGVEPNYLQRVEYGTATPSLAVLVRLAEALSMEPWRLLKPTRASNPVRKPGRPRVAKRTVSRG